MNEQHGIAAQEQDTCIVMLRQNPVPGLRGLVALPTRTASCASPP